MPASSPFANLVRSAIHTLEFIAPVGDLIIRLWVCNVFIKSALSKIVDPYNPFSVSSTTINLFQGYYHVPILSPAVAAYSGTFVEWTMPLLLAIGLMGRFAAVILFFFNIIAFLSLPEHRALDIFNHSTYGLMLMVSMFHGPGKLSIDYLIRRRYMTPLQL